MRTTLPILTLLAALSLTGCKSPELKTSTATIQVYQSSFLPKTDHLAANEAVLLKSDFIISAAAKASEFESDTISSALKVEVIAGTDLLTLSASHDEKSIPKRVVNAVLNAYREHRKKIEADHAKEKMKVLDQELIEQSNLVQEYRKDLTVLIQTHGVPYIGGDGMSPLGTTEEQMFETARKQLGQFETQGEQITIQVKKLIELKDSALIRYAAGLDLPENQVTYYYTRHREALDDKTALLAQGLAEDHPGIRAASKKAELALQNATKEVTSLKMVLETKCELIGKQIKKMKEMVSERNKDKKNLDTRQGRYDEAKAAYEEARDQLRNLKASQQSPRTALESNQPAFIIHGWEER